MLDVSAIKKDFPIFQHDPQLIYLDSAAMSLKPQSMIQAMNRYYEEYSANVFRGVYQLSEKATEEYEKTREKIASFINAKKTNEVIFLRNTSEALNLIAYAWGRLHIGKDDEIVTTILEHHSNFVPWQQLVAENGAIMKVLDINEQGELILDNFENLISKKTKLLAITSVSNAIGTIVPVKEIIKRAKKQNPGIIVVVDAAQAIPHMKVDVQDLGCDFLAFSGQKMLGPTGAGVLWGKEDLLNEMPPFLYGGEMIKEVYLDKTVFAPLPHKFEAGTPHIAGVIGLGAAVDYLENIGMNNVRGHEKKLTEYALSALSKTKNITLFGSKNTERRSGVINFTLKGVHAHDVAQLLDEDKICVRSGHHCAMPLHLRLGVAASVRATFYLYNEIKDIDRLVESIERINTIFRQ